VSSFGAAQKLKYLTSTTAKRGFPQPLGVFIDPRQGLLCGLKRSLRASDQLAFSTPPQMPRPRLEIVIALIAIQGEICPISFLRPRAFTRPRPKKDIRNRTSNPLRAVVSSTLVWLFGRPALIRPGHGPAWKHLNTLQLNRKAIQTPQPARAWSWRPFRVPQQNPDPGLNPTLPSCRPGLWRASTICSPPLAAA